MHEDKAGRMPATTTTLQAAAGATHHPSPVWESITGQQHLPDGPVSHRRSSENAHHHLVRATGPWLAQSWRSQVLLPLQMVISWAAETLALGKDTQASPNILGDLLS